MRGDTRICIAPVPISGSLPVMMFCETPRPLSHSPKHAASHRMSGVSSKEQRSNGPVCMRLMPWRESGMMYPPRVIVLQIIMMWRGSTYVPSKEMVALSSL